MTPEAQLLREVRAHLRATEHLFATLPGSKKAGHLALKARILAERIEKLLVQGGDGAGFRIEGNGDAQADLQPSEG